MSASLAERCAAFEKRLAKKLSQLEVTLNGPEEKPLPVVNVETTGSRQYISPYKQGLPVLVPQPASLRKSPFSDSVLMSSRVSGMTRTEVEEVALVVERMVTFVSQSAAVEQEKDLQMKLEDYQERCWTAQRLHRESTSSSGAITTRITPPGSETSSSSSSAPLSSWNCSPTSSVPPARWGNRRSSHPEHTTASSSSSHPLSHHHHHSGHLGGKHASTTTTTGQQQQQQHKVKPTGALFTSSDFSGSCFSERVLERARGHSSLDPLAHHIHANISGGGLGQQHPSLTTPSRGRLQMINSRLSSGPHLNPRQSSPNLQMQPSFPVLVASTSNPDLLSPLVSAPDRYNRYSENSDQHINGFATNSKRETSFHRLLKPMDSVEPLRDLRHENPDDVLTIVLRGGNEFDQVTLCTARSGEEVGDGMGFGGFEDNEDEDYEEKDKHREPKFSFQNPNLHSTSGKNGAIFHRRILDLTYMENETMKIEQAELEKKHRVAAKKEKERDQSEFVWNSVFNESDDDADSI